MNIYHLKNFDYLKNNLRSLSDSTDRKVDLKNETFYFYGLNKASWKQEYALDTGHGVSSVIVISNHKTFIMLAHRWKLTKESMIVDSENKNITGFPVPAVYFYDLLDYPIPRPNWVRGVVFALIPSLNFYSGDKVVMKFFNDGGRVIDEFRNNAYVFEWEGGDGMNYKVYKERLDGQMVTLLDEFQKYKDPAKYQKIFL